MGKVLQVRVWASTYRDEDVEKAWPLLVALVWPEPFVRPVAGDILGPADRRGVLELVQALDDGLRFAGWDAPVRDALADRVPAIVALRDKLDAALAEWDARAANRITDELEEALDQAEKVLVKAQ